MNGFSFSVRDRSQSTELVQRNFDNLNPVDLMKQRSATDQFTRQEKNAQHGGVSMLDHDTATIMRGALKMRGKTVKVIKKKHFLIKISIALSRMKNATAFKSFTLQVKKEQHGRVSILDHDTATIMRGALKMRGKNVKVIKTYTHKFL